MKYDVIVVGGGPAGATAARECATRGLKTLLLEKEYYPRSKPCAGGVTVAALKLLGAKLPEDSIEASCSTFQAYYRGLHVEIELENNFMIVTSRTTFDQWLAGLAEAAGAAVKQGEAVKLIESSARGVKVHTAFGHSYEGRVLVGADGVNGISARRIRGPWKKEELAFCVCAEVPSGSPCSTQDNSVEVYYGPVTLSYRWVFPKREAFSVGFGGWLGGTKNARKVLEDLIHQKGLKLEGKIMGHHIPLGGIKREVVADGVLLVGDAAGFADPLTGEGIRYAIHSGKLAAETVSNLLTKGLPPTRQNLSSYERACYLAFGKDLTAVYRLCRVVKLFPRMVDKFFLGKEPFYKFLDIVLGEARYSDIYRPMVALKIIKSLLGVEGESRW